MFVTENPFPINLLHFVDVLLTSTAAHFRVLHLVTSFCYLISFVPCPIVLEWHLFNRVVCLTGQWMLV